MKRTSVVAVCALMLSALILALGQAPQRKKFSLTDAQQQEYVQLVRSNSGKTAIEAWAHKHKLQIVSLKGYDIVVIPEQPPTPSSNPEEVSACDVTKCGLVSGVANISNTKGVIVGFQAMTCKATRCHFVWNDKLKSYTRICTDYRCATVGDIR